MGLVESLCLEMVSYVIRDWKKITQKHKDKDKNNG